MVVDVVAVVVYLDLGAALEPLILRQTEQRCPPALGAQLPTRFFAPYFLSWYS